MERSWPDWCRPCSATNRAGDLLVLRIGGDADGAAVARPEALLRVQVVEAQLARVLGVGVEAGVAARPGLLLHRGLARPLAVLQVEDRVDLAVVRGRAGHVRAGAVEVVQALPGGELFDVG